MTDIASQMIPAAHGRTWRDAITPKARASRRRWALAYPALICLHGSLWMSFPAAKNGVGTLAVVALIVVFGMLRRSTRRITALDHPELDERDRFARDRAIRLAYPLLLGVLVITIAVLTFVLPDVERGVRSSSGGTFLIPGDFLGFETLIGLALWLMLWGIFLPTGVLAWCEPDVLEPDPGAPAAGPSEAARDGLLAGALTAGIVLGTVQDAHLIAVLPFVGVLALLGWQARRSDAAQSSEQGYPGGS